jgi:hypothetical protein
MWDKALDELGKTVCELYPFICELCHDKSDTSQTWPGGLTTGERRPASSREEEESEEQSANEERLPCLSGISQGGF